MWGGELTTNPLSEYVLKQMKIQQDKFKLTQLGNETSPEWAMLADADIFAMLVWIWAHVSEKCPMHFFVMKDKQ